MFEMLCGARITNSYVRPGGVFMDAPSEFWDVLDSFITSFPKSIDELEKLITSNEIIFSRTKGIAVLSSKDAIDASITGPILRSTGVDWDLRKRDSYDQNREYSPLKKAEDAICIDTTKLSLSEQVSKIMNIINKE